MRVIRLEARRRVSFLIAEKSMKRRFVGWAASRAGAVSVGRALDSTRPAPGRVYLPDIDSDPTLLRGVDTNFRAPDVQVGGLVVLPSVNNNSASSEIQQIMSETEIRLKTPFKGSVAVQQLTGRRTKKEGPEMNGDTQSQINRSRNDMGTTFKVAPKVDQSKVYDAVFDKLGHGGCVGIYPEGGSHDRTELLPLKGTNPPYRSAVKRVLTNTAGVAIMALGAVANYPNCGLKIVPCGMNYFHAHKFRSRAVLEFGAPLDVPPELVELFKKGSRREAIGRMLELIYDSLVAVTVTSPDYDTLMASRISSMNPDTRLTIG